MSFFDGIFDPLTQLAPTPPEWKASPEPPVLLDVNTKKEFQQTRIEGSRNIPLSHLRERIAELPDDRIVVVCCRTGYRSAMASGILEQSGLTNVMHMVGGIAAWKGSGLATIP